MRNLEVRWHGRGGQGAKTAAVLLAEAAAAAGFHVQGFPEYGPERMGAPVVAFNRISDRPITIRSVVDKPDAVVVLDPTLIGRVDVVHGLGADGLMIVNSTLPPGELKRVVPADGFRLYTVDAGGIARETIGREIPNTPLIGALARVVSLFEDTSFLPNLESLLTRKFRHKSGAVAPNLEAVRRGAAQVVGLA